MRLKAWPRCAPLVWVPALIFILFAVLAGFGGASYAAAEFGVLGSVLMCASARECGVTMRAVLHAAVSCGLLDDGRVVPVRARKPEPTREKVVIDEVRQTDG